MTMMRRNTQAKRTTVSRLISATRHRGFGTRIATMGVVLLVSQTSAQAQLGEVESKVGDWTIFRSQDPMTDKPSCVAIFKAATDIQLTSNSLAIGANGIRGYKMRFDDLNAGEMQLPSDIEKQVGAVILEGGAFQRIMQSRRLRFQALTYSGVENQDIDLSAAADALRVLGGSRCN
jgi:hypothetical protein